MIRIFEVFHKKSNIPSTVVLATDVVDAINTLKLHDEILASYEVTKIDEVTSIKYVSENVKRIWEKENA